MAPRHLRRANGLCLGPVMSAKLHGGGFRLLRLAKHVKEF